MADTPETESPPVDTSRVARWALLGAVSGLAATLSIFVPQWIGIYGEVKFDLGPVGLFFSPLSLGPGLVFGLIVGYALRRAGLAGGWRYPSYIAGATISYFAAVQLSVNFLIDAIDNVVAVGIIAGLFGAALLTAMSAALIPAFRRRPPIIATIAAGGILGALLYIPIEQDHFFYWLALYAPWQAGYAAAMATALPAEPETR
jgi:hypothetical protein